MENEEMLEQTNETENVDTQTTEEIGEGIELTDTSNTEESVEEKAEVKMFTQEEVNEIVRKRLARQERDNQKELSKYRSTEEVLKKGLNATDISDAEAKLREFWKGEGIDLPEPVKPGLTDDEIKILANSEAQEIIESGEAEEEANRLASKGFDNMNSREKVMFNKLAEHLTREKQVKELKSIGAKTDVIDSKEFKDFASKFNSNTSIKDVYDLYSKTHREEKNAEKMGSMITEKPSNKKDFYTMEEISKLTEADLEDPNVWRMVRNSMTSQK